MTKYLMCIYWGHICIFISNTKFLSLILWLGGLCTDTNADNADADAPTPITMHDGQIMIT